MIDKIKQLSSFIKSTFDFSFISQFGKFIPFSKKTLTLSEAENISFSQIVFGCTFLATLEKSKQK